MTKQLSQFIHQVPTIIWLLLPALLTAIITVLITKNRKRTLLNTLLAALITGLAVGFHFWEKFLNNHFVASFDETGLPTSFTRSGWWLLIDAWPLWFIPCLIVGALAVTAYFLFDTGSAGNNDVESIDSNQQNSRANNDSGSRQAVKDRLEVEDLKQQLAVANEKYRQLSDSKKGKSVKTDRFAEEIRGLRGDINRLNQEKAKLESKLEAGEEELQRANSLIDRLLNEKFEDL